MCPRRDRTPTHTHSHSAHSLLPLTVCVSVINSQFNCFTFHISRTHTHTHTTNWPEKDFTSQLVLFLVQCLCSSLRAEKKKASVFNEFVPKALIHTYAVHTHTSAVYIYTNSVVGMDSSSSPMSLIAGVKCNLSAPVRVENAG